MRYIKQHQQQSTYAFFFNTKTVSLSCGTMEYRCYRKFDGRDDGLCFPCCGMRPNCTVRRLRHVLEVPCSSFIPCSQFTFPKYGHIYISCCGFHRRRHELTLETLNDIRYCILKISAGMASREIALSSVELGGAHICTLDP